MRPSTLQLAIWYASTGLEAYVVALIVWRRFFKVLPLFAAYVCFVLVKSVGLWLVRGELVLYYWSYRIGQLIALVLTFLVILELYRRLFESYPAIRSFVQSVLVTVLVALALSSVILTRIDPHWLRRWTVLFERSLRFVQVGLLILFFFVVYYLGLRLDARVRGVAVGFALYATLELANFALVAHFYYAYERVWDLSSAAAYLATLVVWSVYLTARVPEPARATPAVPVGVLAELESAIRKRAEEINHVLWRILRGRLP